MDKHKDNGILLATNNLVKFVAGVMDLSKPDTITSVGEYSKERFSKEDALSQYLIPYVYSKDLDAHAEKFLKKYCPKALETPMPLPIKEVLEAVSYRSSRSSS